MVSTLQTLMCIFWDTVKLYDFYTFWTRRELKIYFRLDFEIQFVSYLVRLCQLVDRRTLLWFVRQLNMHFPVRTVPLFGPQVFWHLALKLIRLHYCLVPYLLLSCKLYLGVVSGALVYRWAEVGFIKFSVVVLIARWFFLYCQTLLMLQHFFVENTGPY